MLKNIKYFLIIAIAIIVSSFVLYRMNHAVPLSYTATTATDTPKKTDRLTSDAIVVGAGPGGIAAAIELARSGHSVMLIEETDWLGGQMTAAAVPNMDEGYLLKSDPGIFGEFITRVKEKYGDKPINVCYWGTKSRCFEPHIGRQVLEEMIASEPNITLLYRTRVSRVWKTGGNITGVQTTSKLKENDDKNITSRILIDASETGYLLDLAGAKYRISNSTNLAQGTVVKCIQSNTYTAVLRKYFNGVPPALLFTPGNPPGGMESYMKSQEIFARSVIAGGATWFSDGKLIRPYDWSFSTGYRAIPDSNPKATNYSATNIQPNDNDPEHHYTIQISKTILNMSNDYPANTKYFDSKDYKVSTDCQAKLKTLQNIYYIQVDLGEKDWSIANDEGYDTPYNIEENQCPNLKEFREFEKFLPVLPYIRESRRLIGEYTLTGKDIVPMSQNGINVASKKFDSSLALGDYGNDLHACNKPTDLENELESKSDERGTWRIFQVPYESFITKDVGGLIAAEKNLSVSRLTAGALRLQPSSMQTGLAAGAIAVVALNTGKNPAEIDYHTVQAEILKAKGEYRIPSGKQ